MKVLLLIVVMSVVRSNLYAAANINGADLMYSSLMKKGRGFYFIQNERPSYKKVYKVPKQQTPNKMKAI